MYSRKNGKAVVVNGTGALTMDWQNKCTEELNSIAMMISWATPIKQFTPIHSFTLLQFLWIWRSLHEKSPYSHFKETRGKKNLILKYKENFQIRKNSIGEDQHKENKTNSLFYTSLNSHSNETRKRLCAKKSYQAMEMSLLVHNEHPETWNPQDMRHCGLLCKWKQISGQN